MSKMVGFKLGAFGVVPLANSRNGFAQALTEALEEAMQSVAAKYGAQINTLAIAIDNGELNNSGDRPPTTHTRDLASGEEETERT